MSRRLRGSLSTDSLLKIILLLVIVWVVLRIADEFVDVIQRLVGPFDSLLGLVIVVLILLYLLDRI
jgi:hypothetical protein